MTKKLMFGRVISLAQRLLHLLCVRVKHFVLGWAHPLPHTIRVYPGEEGSIEHAIISRVLQSVPEATLTAPDSTRLCTKPCIFLDGEWVASGWQSVVRYLGSIDRSMPTTPKNALKVNMFLEIVSEIVARPPVDQRELETALIPFETAIERDGVRPDKLGGLGSTSLADVVAWEALQYVVDALAENFDWSKLPLTKMWFQLESIDTPLDDGEEEGGEEGEEGEEGGEEGGEDGDVKSGETEDKKDE